MLPLLLAKVPIGHFVQAVAPGMEEEPAAQLAQLVIGKVTSKKGVTKITYTCDISA